MSVRHFWICGLLLAALSGCNTFRYQSPELLNDQKLTTRLFVALDERVPPMLQSSQRVVLSSGIREWDFLGFLRFDPNGDFRAKLVPEMGGKALDIEYIEATSTTRVLWSVPTFPKEMVKESVPADIKHLFGRYPLEICRAARHSGGKNSLVVQLAPDHTIEYVFDKKNESVVESFETQGGQLTRRATYAKLKDFPKAKINRLTPSRLRLKNLKENYKLDVQILLLEFPEASVRVHDENEDKNAKQTANTRQPANKRQTPQTRQSLRAATPRVTAPQPRQNPALEPDESLTPTPQTPLNQQDLAEQRALLSQQRAIERRLQALRETNPDLTAPVVKPAPARPIPQETPYPQPDEALLPDPSDGMLQQPAPEAPRKTTPLRRRTNRFIRTR